jgi:hypothetical protein
VAAAAAAASLSLGTTRREGLTINNAMLLRIIADSSAAWQ